MSCLVLHVTFSGFNRDRAQEPEQNHREFNHALVPTSGYCVARVANSGKQMKRGVSEQFAEIQYTVYMFIKKIYNLGIKFLSKCVCSGELALCK